MRIAQIAPLFEAVPPKLYGGTERVVHWITEALVQQGHDVTLFASGDSQTSAKLVPVWPQALRLSIPGIVNIAVDLFKDTTLVSIVGLFDLMGVVNQSMKDPAWLGLAAEGYTFAAIVFFFACLVISLGGSLLERRFAVAHRR